MRIDYKAIQINRGYNSSDQNLKVEFHAMNLNIYLSKSEGR